MLLAHSLHGWTSQHYASIRVHNLFFFLVKRNIHRQQSYPTLEVRPLQTVLTILTLQFPAKSELIKHKISALDGWLKTTKVSFIRHPHLASASAGQFPSLKSCCTWTRWNPLSKHLQSRSTCNHNFLRIAWLFYSKIDILFALDDYLFFLFLCESATWLTTG